MDQGVATPYTIEAAENGTQGRTHLSHYHKPRRTGHVRDLTHDSDVDPYWNAPPDPNVVRADHEVEANIVAQMRAQLLRQKVTKMAEGGVSATEIAATIRRHQDRHNS